MGTKPTVAAAIGAAVVVLASVAGGCQIRAETDQLGQPGAGTEPVDVAMLESDIAGLGGVDFDNAVYASACGLSWIEVGAGVGEGPSVAGIYGLEVIEVAIADLDGEPGDEAVVLVDCLGGDTYSAHVLGFDVDDLSGSEGGRVVLLPSTGGSLPAGQRPVGIDATPAGEVLVQLSGSDGIAEHPLRWSTHLMSGGELAPVADSVVHGVVAAVEEDGVLVVSLAPGVGYRLATPDGLMSIDPDTGATLAAAEMSGRPAKVSLDAAGSVAGVELLAVGAA